jgi:hypothetical protein
MLGIVLDYRHSAQPGFAANHASGRRSLAEPMITKPFFIAKTFRAHSTNFFRQEKSLRDHRHALGRSL